MFVTLLKVGKKVILIRCYKEGEIAYLKGRQNKKIKKILLLPGIEPGLTRPQRDVIPLDHNS